jgi:hypothetical protein
MPFDIGLAKDEDPQKRGMVWREKENRKKDGLDLRWVGRMAAARADRPLRATRDKLVPFLGVVFQFERRLRPKASLAGSLGLNSQIRPLAAICCPWEHRPLVAASCRSAFA